MKFNKAHFSQISIPSGVKIEKKKDFLTFSGVLGFTSLQLTKIDPTGIGGIQISEDQKNLILFSESKSFKASLKSLLKNKIRGVSVGFLVSLRIVGVGYRASLEESFPDRQGQILTSDITSGDVKSDVTDLSEGLLANSIKTPPKVVLEGLTPLANKSSICQSVRRVTFLHFKLGYSHNLKYQLPESIRAFLLEPSLLCIFGIDKNQVSQLGSKIRSFKPPERYKGKGIRFTTEKITLSQGKRK